MILGKKTLARLRWVAAGFMAAVWPLLAGGARADVAYCDAAHEFDPCYIVDAGDADCGQGIAGLGDVENLNGECVNGLCCKLSAVPYPPTPDASDPDPPGDVALGGSGCNTAGGLVGGSVWSAILGLTVLGGYSICRGTSRSRRRRRQCPD